MRVTTLLLGSILLFMVVNATGRTTRAPNASRPLSAADVEHGLKSAVPNARMAALVKKYGVDFELTGAVKQELRSAGASDNLILQIGRSRVPIPMDDNSVKPTGHSAGIHAHRSANTPRAHAQPGAKELLSQADKYRLGSGVVRNEAKAAQLYRKAAEMGNAEAETRFAEALFDGRGVARDPAESRAWLEKAAHQGNARGECDLGVMLTNGLDIAQDRAKGLEYFQAAARLGDGYAEDNLGQFAESGFISDPSSSEAYMHYLKASEMGSAWGAYNVARMHEHGIGVYKNLSEALRWYMKVASIEDPDLPGQWSDLRSEAGAVAAANFRIGDMYVGGNGVPEDTHEAEKWYKRGVDMESAGARAGWLMAQVYLANAYLQSKGVPPDYGEAMHWMRKAAENGYRQAQVSLGSLYRDGQGTPKNYGEAMYWYRKAADQGSAMGEWMIGRLYFQGRGVTRDFAEASTWFRRAAEAGVPVAQWDLGMMYYHGYGVSKDLANARAWVQKAAARGYAPAKEMLAKFAAGDSVTANAAADADVSSRPARLQ
jgi:TPR repeat protein